MFGFFDEIRKKCNKVIKKIDTYKCIHIGDRLLYVEGFVSLLTLSNDVVVFKVKGGIITVNGKGLYIEEMSLNTITIAGKILQVESL